MSIFRTIGQESESDNIHQFKGFLELPEDVQPLVLEVYQNTYLANQGKGLKIALGIAMATAKSVCETYLIERRCSSCGRQMKEVRVSGGKHQFCPICHPKAMGYGDMKRMKEGEEKNDPAELPNVKPSTDAEKDAETKDQLGGGFERDKQRENVLSKRSEEDQPKSQWGSSPATPPDSSDDLIGGALAIMKKNHTGKGMHDAMSEERMTQPKHVIRKGSLTKDEYLQHDNSFGPHKTARRFPSANHAEAHAEKHLGHLNGNYGIFAVSNPRKMKEDNAASLQGQNVVKTQSQEEMPNKQPQFDRLTGFMASEKEIRPMTEAEYQLYEDSVTGALKTAKKQGYQLNGEPKQSHIGMSFKMSHPHGHSLNVHMTPDHGMGWSHTHKNGTRKSGSDPYSLGNHLQSMEEKYIGFKKLEGKLSHEKGVYDPAGLAAAIGRKKYGSKGFSTHKHMDEAEDAHGNQLTKVDASHPSYKAGQKYARGVKKMNGASHPIGSDGHTMTARFSDNNLHTMVHQKAVDHSKDTEKRKSTLQDKLHMQRHFKAGAHAVLGLATPKGIEEESSKEIQTKNFQEKCDFCGKLHGVGPCPMLNSPAMQEDDSLDIQKSNLKKKCKDCGLVHDADTSCEEAATKSDKDTKSSEADAANDVDNEASKVDEEEISEGKKLYVGHKGQGKYEVFSHHESPTQASHGHIYSHVIGPFRSRKGADFMASPAARNNPHVRSAGDADRIANMKESEWEVSSPAYPGSTPTAPPAYECGGDWDAKSILNKNHKEKGDPVEEHVVQEMDKHTICFCGHEYGSHSKNGCKSCHREGHVDSKMAAHAFRPNANVRMESQDPMLQAAVNWIADRVNVKGITESAMPKPAIHQRDKWSNSFLVEAKSENPLHTLLTQHGYQKGKKLKGHGGFEGHNFTHPETKRVIEVSHSPSLHYWADVSGNHASSGAHHPEDHVEAMKKHLASVGKK